MIYFFTGNNDFQIRDEVGKWKQKFCSTYGDFNFFHVKDVSSLTQNYLAEIMLSSSFLGDKKFILIENYPYMLSAKDTEENEEGDDDVFEKSGYAHIDAFLLENLAKLPEGNTVLFVSSVCDKRTKIYKEIIKVAEVREYSYADEADALRFLAKRFPGVISAPALKLLYAYKGENVSKVASEIEKLTVIKTSIEVSDIENYISPELEENIFMIVDNLLNKNAKNFFKNTSTVLSYMNIYAFYNSLLGNLRNFVYIATMKQKGISTAKIGAQLGLGNRAFLVNKNFKISPLELQKLYLDMIDLDKKKKSGKMLDSGGDEDFLYEIERVVLTHM